MQEAGIKQPVSPKGRLFWLLPLIFGAWDSIIYSDKYKVGYRYCRPFFFVKIDKLYIDSIVNLHLKVNISKKE